MERWNQLFERCYFPLVKLGFRFILNSNECDGSDNFHLIISQTELRLVKTKIKC